MASSRSTEIKVGLGVILSVIVLVVGVMWIGEFQFNRKYVSYTAVFEEVGGLGEGDPVAVSGLKMGKVGDVTLEAGKVSIELLIEEQAVLKTDSRVEIRAIGLMGEKYVYILPGEAGERLAPGSIIEGEFKADLPDIVAEIGDMMDDIKATSRSLARLVSGMEEESNLGESLAKLNEVSDEILSLLRANKDDIRSSTRNLKSATAGMNEVFGGSREDLAEGIARFSSAAARLDTLTASLQSVARSIEEGDGTLGMLIKERKLHEQMESTLQSMEELIADIKANPDRYITVEIF
jgi:phospholipid/cholesterol/gamma-HCH transport system substrate-binding protein